MFALNRFERKWKCKERIEIQDLEFDHFTLVFQKEVCQNEKRTCGAWRVCSSRCLWSLNMQILWRSC